MLQQPLRAAFGSDSRSATLTVLLVLALIGAPATSALRNECSICPRTCPMHHAREAAEAARPQLNCHAAPAGAAHHHRPSAHTRGPAFGRATCGTHAVVAAIVLPPVILPAARPLPILTATQSAPRPDRTWQARLTDPPDTPPPIAAA